MTPQITFGIIVLNGEPFIGYNLRALYPFAQQIIVVEGACFAAKDIARQDGHSNDNTLETLRRFRTEEDPENKLVIVTAEDEGYPDGFWPEKDEMSEAYAKRATGNYLWQVDVDEFYLPQDMQKIIDTLSANPDMAEIDFPALTFWGALDYIVDSFFLRRFNVKRLFKWGKGYSYDKHRPPTVLDNYGRDLQSLNLISAKEMACKGIFLYHYELLFPKQVIEKCSYYSKADWTKEMPKADEWARKCFLNLSDPFRVHMLYRKLSWLKRFCGQHPTQVIKMVEDVKKSLFKDIELRKSNDIEFLLKTPFYRFIRTLLIILAPFYNGLVNLKMIIRTILLKTPLWPIIRFIKGGAIAVKKEVIPARLNKAWENPRIPKAQALLVAQELRNIYAGKVIRPYQVLAEAVRLSGCENGEIVEVGCASGYYSEVLQYLLGHEINYKGIDYSRAMISAARQKYPHIIFAVGDATALPYADNSCDVLISGCVILHVLDYQKVIAESSRVSHKWVIFHRTPITNGPTRYFKKRAYGITCFEIHFNEEEFINICSQNKLRLQKEFKISAGETICKTYLFEKV